MVAPPPEPTISKIAAINFSHTDREGLIFLKNEALVISARILRITVERILIDNGCYCNIIFKTTLGQMGNLAIFVKPYDQ